MNAGIRRAPLLAIAVALALAAGCRERSSVWHCINTARAACSQWVAIDDGATAEQQKQKCVEIGGRVHDGTCPDEGIVGSCIGAGETNSRIVYYAPRDAEEARAACSMLGGTWR